MELMARLKKEEKGEMSMELMLALKEEEKGEVPTALMESHKEKEKGVLMEQTESLMKLETGGPPSKILMTPRLGPKKIYGIKLLNCL